MTRRFMFSKGGGSCRVRGRGSKIDYYPESLCEGMERKGMEPDTIKAWIFDGEFG